MSLFGDSPPARDATPISSPSRGARSRALFDDDVRESGPNERSMFSDPDDAEDGSASPALWDMPTPRKARSRAEIVRNLLVGAAVPDFYTDAFDRALELDAEGNGSLLSMSGVLRVLDAAGLAGRGRAKILELVMAPTDAGEGANIGRNEFNVLLALIGLAQEDETISLDGVDERRRSLPQPRLLGFTPEPVMPSTADLASKPPQTPVKAHTHVAPIAASPRPNIAPAMSFPDQDDPWNTPDVHKNHRHTEDRSPAVNGVPPPQDEPPQIVEDIAASSQFTTTSTLPDPVASPTIDQYGPSSNTSVVDTGRQSVQISASSITGPGRSDSVGGIGGPGGGAGVGWGFYDSSGAGAGFPGSSLPNPANPFGGPDVRSGSIGAGNGRDATQNPLAPVLPRTTSSGRTGGAIEEHIVVGLMPEKEGLFFFQHHNYEVSSSRRGSKVIRRYSDFAWLLECLHKRYPFRALPLLPPKRPAINGNHLSNDGAFIEKRRRGLARFLNALVRHPLLSQEQLVIMFLTVPTELSVWRKQATISVQDEFAGRALPLGLEDSLPPSLEQLFERTRNAIKRSAELYITVCNVMDRLVKRTEGVAADHARIAVALTSLIETSADTYATDTSDVPLLNAGLRSTSKHLNTCQSLLEDESRAWDEGVLEDLKRQRDSLVSVRDLFERRDRLDRDTIPYLERRINTNEIKLADLRSKPEGLVKPAEIEKVAESIIKDKESIVQQHNRSIFVKECLRDELVYFQATQYHVSRWNQDWAQERVKYAEMLADNWRRLLDELDAMPLGE